jgi:hypothetical protein
LYGKEHRTDRRLACRLRLGKSSLFTQLKMTDRCCNTSIVKHYSLVDKKIKQPMNEFFCLFSTGKYSFRYFFFSCLIEEKGLSHFLFIINHSRNEQQHTVKRRRRRRRRGKKLL